jgi:hypothetical protein
MAKIKLATFSSTFKNRLLLLSLSLLLLVFLYWFGGIVFEVLTHLIRVFSAFIGNEFIAAVLLITAYFAGMLLIDLCSRWVMFSNSLGKLFITTTLVIYLLPFLAIIIRLVFSFDASVCDFGSGRYCE